MSYREYAPAPALRRHVACHWTLTLTEQTAPEHRVLPDGCMDLLLRVDRDGDVVVNVVGTMTRAFVAPSATVTGFAGIRFRPGEALAFLDVAAADARDALLSPRDAGLGNIADLAEKVASRRPSEWPTALDAWLLSRIFHARSADTRVRCAVELIGAAHGSVRVSELALHVGVSERQLERAFAERVGLSPKLLARVLRLRALVGSLDSFASASAPWARLAAQYGFADQAHLVREVRALAGVTPTDLVRERVSGLFNTRGGASAIHDARSGASRKSTP